MAGHPALLRVRRVSRRRMSHSGWMKQLEQSKQYGTLQVPMQRSEVLMAVYMKSAVLRNVTTCSPIGRHECFRETCCFHPHGRWIMLVSIYQSTYHHVRFEVFTALTMKNIIIRVTRIGEVGTKLAVTSNQSTLLMFLACWFLSPWWRRWYVPLKRQFLQQPHGITSQKTAILIRNIIFIYFIHKSYVHMLKTKCNSYCSKTSLIWTDWQWALVQISESQNYGSVTVNMSRGNYIM
jgi:hypothetical protein